MRAKVLRVYTCMKSKIRSPFSWSKTKVTWVSILALIVALGYTELTAKKYTILSTYFLANFDSSTIGTIKASRVSCHAAMGICEYHIRYSYQIDDQKYSGDLVDLGIHSGSDAQQVVAKYYVDRKVQVFYDSKAPQYSVLENSGLSIEFAVTTIFLFAFIPFGIWFYFRLNA
jgi:hypothetical protein